MKKEEIIATVHGEVEQLQTVGDQTLKAVSFKKVVYLNDSPLGEFDEIFDILLSASGKKCAFIGKLKGDIFLCQQPGDNANIRKFLENYDDKYHVAYLIGFSPDEQRLLWAAKRRYNALYDIYLGGVLLSTIYMRMGAVPLRDHFTYVFSPNNKSVAWVQWVSNTSYGNTVSEHCNLMIDTRLVCYLGKFGIDQLIWLNNSQLMFLDHGGRLNSLSFGQKVPEKIFPDAEFARLLASPDNNDCVLIERKSIGGGYYDHAIIYKNYVKKLREKSANLVSRVDIKFNKNKMYLYYPNVADPEIVIL